MTIKANYATGISDIRDFNPVMDAAEGSEPPESIYDLDGDGDVDYTDATIVHDASGEALPSDDPLVTHARFGSFSLRLSASR